MPASWAKASPRSTSASQSAVSSICGRGCVASHSSSVTPARRSTATYGQCSCTPHSIGRAMLGWSRREARRASPSQALATAAPEQATRGIVSMTSPPPRGSTASQLIVASLLPSRLRSLKRPKALAPVGGAETEAAADGIAGGVVA